MAGVQLQNADADEVKRQIIELTKKQFDEAEEKEKMKVILLSDVKNLGKKATLWKLRKVTAATT